MAQISSISNGEALSSVRTKLNDVITNVNLLDPTGWVDYSSTSTVVGWSSTPTKIIRYRIIGKQMFVQFNLSGTSNSTAASFTLPNNATALNMNIFAYAINNGAFVSSVTHGSIASGSNTLSIFPNNALWTASGTKTTSGQFFIEIA
jgi:hypothetical protein